MPSIWLLALAALLTLAASPVQAAQIGTITVCYACDGDGTFKTGDSAVDTVLANNPNTAYDGILFVFKNSSAFPITGGVISVGGDASPADSFALPAIPAGGEFILLPGITSDGAPHPDGGLFAATANTADTSEGDGGVDDSTIFKFTGTSNGQTVTSTTAGTSTAVPGTFTPGDPGLIKPWLDAGSTGKTSFIGLGPDGDGGCTDCYYGVVATLNAGAGATGSSLQFTTTTLPAGTVGVPYSATIGAAGGASPYTFLATDLPAGLVLSTGGALTGIPFAPGGYIFSVKVTDSAGSSLTSGFTVIIAPTPITITTSSPLPSGMNGVPYPPQLLSGIGGTGAYTWSITGGSLPAGMALTPDGILSGVPTAQSTFSITVTAADIVAPATKATATLALTIRPPRPISFSRRDRSPSQ